jgi:hypothetical protein
LKRYPRRDFLTRSALLAGCAGLGLGTLAASGARAATGKLEASGRPPALPWGYQLLDPEKVRKLGHLASYVEGCGGGAFWAIMTVLKEKLGGPYSSCMPLPDRQELLAYLADRKKRPMPQVMMLYTYSGMSGFGSLCGTVNGAAAAVSIALPFKTADKIVPRLLRYYESTPLPTSRANNYAAGGKYLLPKLLAPGKLPQSVSHSVLCHVSVGNWCQESGFASGSKERLERCARLTGDIAAQAVVLMNSWQAGKLESEHPLKLSAATESCRKCHFEGPDAAAGQFTRGSMECAGCHGEMAGHFDKKQGE